MSATIALVLRKDKKNEKGEYPIRIRIIKNRKPSYASTGQRIAEIYWDEKQQKVKSKHPNSVMLNHHLNTLINKYQNDILVAETSDTTLSTKKIKDKINGKQTTSLNFYDLAEQVAEKYLREGKIAIYKRSKSVISKIREFSGKQKLEISDIDVRLLKQYDQYCREERANRTNTINKDFATIRRVFSEAFQNELIPFEKNPFHKFKIENEKTSKTYLTEEELQKIISVDLSKRPLYDLHRDMFVFSATSGGLRISDVLLLKWKNFDSTYLRFTMRKTKGQLRIKLPLNSLKLINKYHTDSSKPADFIFPVLNSELDFTDAIVLHKAISSATAHINKNLKDVSKLAKVEKSVSTHIARHTFATMALSKGATIDKVSKILGHSQVRETQIYAKIINKDLDDAMDLFND